MIKIVTQDKRYVSPGRFIADLQDFKFFVNDLIDMLYELKREKTELILDIDKLKRKNEKLTKELNLYKQMRWKRWT